MTWLVVWIVKSFITFSNLGVTSGSWVDVERTSTASISATSLPRCSLISSELVLQNCTMKAVLALDIVPRDFPSRTPNGRSMPNGRNRAKSNSPENFISLTCRRLKLVDLAGRMTSSSSVRFNDDGRWDASILFSIKLMSTASESCNIDVFPVRFQRRRLWRSILILFWARAAVPMIVCDAVSETWKAHSFRTSDPHSTSVRKQPSVSTRLPVKERIMTPVFRKFSFTSSGRCLDGMTETCDPVSIKSLSVFPNTLPRTTAFSPICLQGVTSLSSTRLFANFLIGSWGWLLPYVLCVNEIEVAEADFVAEGVAVAVGTGTPG